MSVQGRIGLRKSGTSENVVTSRWADVIQTEQSKLYLSKEIVSTSTE